MTTWTALEQELEHWGQSGRVATMWWRDDDAARASEPLSRLLMMAGNADVPLALAVVPARMDASLGCLLARHQHATVIQHGYSHQNHARVGEKKIELGTERPFMHALGDLATGWQRLESALGRQARQVLVPPWNRIAPGLIPLLPEVGFRGLSTFGARRRRWAVERLALANAHVDIIDWHHTRRFVGLELALGQVLAHLKARRLGQLDSTEPTGLMTHHADHDSECWAFVEALLTRTRGHTAIQWLSVSDVFETPAHGEPGIDARRDG